MTIPAPPPPRPSRPRFSTKAEAGRLAGAALLLAAAWLVFAPTLHGDWLWDDLLEIPLNPMVTAGWAGLRQIWIVPLGPDYLPLKASVQWAQWHAWHTHHSGYHLTNILLQTGGALLLWRTLARLGLRFAWLGGLLFIVHPLFVESVAWVSQLKNTLSFIPLLLAFHAYWDWDGKAGPLYLNRRYLGAVLWFVISLLCKTSGVMFPFALLLYAWWRRGRIGKTDLWASLPFFAASLGLGAATYWYQHHVAMVGWQLYQGGLGSRLAGAGLAAAFYFSKFVWPRELLPIYPRWHVVPPAWIQFLPWLLLGVVLALLWHRRSGWGRHALFGLGWFLLHLAPVLGFVAMSFLHIAPVADHLAYLSAVGLIGLVVAGLEKIPAATPAARTALWASLALAAAGLASESRRHAARFANQETLWAYTAARNPSSPAVHGNLGFILNHDGQIEASLAEYRRALELAPNDAFAEKELAEELEFAGYKQEAAEHFRRAVQLDPALIDPRLRLAQLLAAAGQLPEAAEHYRRALQLQPGMATVENALGVALADQADPAKWPEAAEHYRTALRLQPAYAEAENNLGILLAKQARWNEAIVHFEKAVALKPDMTKAQNNLGFALAQAGRPQEALAPLQRAVELDPGDASARYNFGVLLQTLGRRGEARAQFEEALRLRPDFPQARERLAQLPAGP